MARSRIDIILSARDRASRGFRRTGKAAGEAATETEKARRALKEFEDEAGEADSILQGLAGALDNIAPGLGEVIRLSGDTAGGLEAVARAGSVSVGAVGALAVVVGVAAAAYLILNERLRVAVEAQERAAETAELAAGAYDALAAAQGRTITGDEKRAQAIAAEINALNERREELKKSIDDNSTFADSASGILIGLKAANAAFREFTGRNAELESLNTELATTERILADLGRLGGAPVFETFGPELSAGDQTRILNDRRRASEELSRALAEEADAERALADARRDADISGRDALTAARVALSQAGAQGVDVSGFQGQLGGITDLARETGTLGGGVEQALRELVAAIGLATEEHLENAEGVALENAVRDRAEQQQAREAARAQQAQVGRIGAAGQVATGDVAPLLARAGIIGAIIGAALEIGREGESGIEEKLQTLEQTVAGFFQAVPGLIGRVAPEFAARTIEAGPQIIADLIPALIEGLISAALSTGPLVITEAVINSLLNVDWSRLGSALVEAFKSGFAGLVDNPVIGQQTGRTSGSFAGVVGTAGQQQAANAIALTTAASRLFGSQRRRTGN